MDKTFMGLQVIQTVDLPDSFYNQTNQIKYVSVDSLQRFIEDKDVVVFDKRKIFHNYLKYDLKDLMFLDQHIEEIDMENGLTQWTIKR